MTRLACRTCKLCDMEHYTPNGITSVCKAHPPTDDRKWPQVDVNVDWCSQHQEFHEELTEEERGEIQRFLIAAMCDLVPLPKRLAVSIARKLDIKMEA